MRASSSSSAWKKILKISAGTILPARIAPHYSIHGKRAFEPSRLENPQSLPKGQPTSTDPGLGSHHSDPDPVHGCPCSRGATFNGQACVRLLVNKIFVRKQHREINNKNNWVKIGCYAHLPAAQNPRPRAGGLRQEDPARREAGKMSQL